MSPITQLNLLARHCTSYKYIYSVKCGGGELRGVCRLPVVGHIELTETACARVVLFIYDNLFG